MDLLPNDPTVQDAPPAPSGEPTTQDATQAPADNAGKWYDQYKDNPELKDSINTLDRYKTAEDALKDLDQKHRTLSKKLIDIPGEDANPESINEFLSSIRSKLPDNYKVPETADGYKLSATIPGENGTEIPIPVNDSSLKEIQNACHKCGIDNSTFNNLVKEVFNAQVNAPVRAKQQIQEWLTAESKHNPNMPSYEEFSNTVNTEYAKFPDELKTALKDIPNDALSRVIHHYASKNGEYKFPDNIKSTATVRTLQQVNDDINKLMRDPDYRRDAMMGQGTKWDQHAALIQERNKIQRGEK